MNKIWMILPTEDLKGHVIGYFTSKSKAQEYMERYIAEGIYKEGSIYIQWDWILE